MTSLRFLLSFESVEWPCDRPTSAQTLCKELAQMQHNPGHSPVTLADCKITTYEDGPLCVDVRFETKDQLNDLIEALSLLREATEFDHIHLQDDPNVGYKSTAGTEIVFHMPGSCFDSTRKELIAHAERRIESSNQTE